MAVIAQPLVSEQGARSFPSRSVGQYERSLGVLRRGSPASGDVTAG